MDDLQKAAYVYNSLLRKSYSYALSDGNIFEFFFAPKNFCHLIGLHKLKDIVLPQNKNTLFNRILNGKITLNTIQKSKFFSKVDSRIKLFPEIKKLLFLDTAYEFDKSKIICSLNAKYLFFDNKSGLGLYFAVGFDKGKNYFYPETFFTRSHDHDYYIRNQKQLDVISLEITPKYNYEYLLPNQLSAKLDAVHKIIGISPSYNNILREIEGINTTVEVIEQQKFLMNEKEKHFKDIEQYLKTREDAALSIRELKEKGFSETSDAFKEVSSIFEKADKLFSLSGFKSSDDFYEEYSKFLAEKDEYLKELDKQITSLTDKLNLLYDAKISLESHYHREVVDFYKKEYSGAIKWTQQDTNLIRKLNETHKKALTFDELNQLPKTDEILKVLNLFNHKCHDREIER